MFIAKVNYINNIKLTKIITKKEIKLVINLFLLYNIMNWYAKGRFV